MKKLIFSLSLVLISYSNSFSQLPGSYPFKTVVDNNGNLYVTGDSLNPASNTLDFIVKKFVSGIHDWTYIISNPNGDDKGLDIVIDNEGKVLATGYTKNQFNRSEIILVKLNSFGGDSIWTRRFSTNSHCEGYGITVDPEGNPYVTGYCSNINNTKDIITLKYSSQQGTLQWSRIYNNKTYKQDDVGTDILVDNNYVYVMGSTYNGEVYKNDLILLNYKLNGSNEEIDIFKRRETNETPTGFVITGKGLLLDKSRIAITSVTDNTSDPYHNASSYLTICYDGGAKMDLKWKMYYSRNPDYENIATSISADKNGDVYVTGYCNSDRTGYDFATIKYKGLTGDYAWTNTPVLFYDAGSGDDKSSSVKVFGDSVYVSGSSQFNPGGYRTLAYRQNEGTVEPVWDNIFIPSFSNDRNALHRASLLNIDTTTGNIISMVMAWDNHVISKYAIIAYSGSGNTLYTIDYNDSDSDQSQNAKTKNTNNLTFDLAQNYPNPFNPSTVIRYSLPDDRFINLKVYNMLGKEVSSLVNEKQTAGNYEVTFDGSNLSSGIYYYTIYANGKVFDTKRMILMK